MQLRNLFLGVVVGATFVLAACDARPDPDPEEDAGCIGACDPRPDAGPPDAGPDAGNPCVGLGGGDGGVVTMEQLRSLAVCYQYVTVENVVVHTVINKASRTSTIDGGVQWLGEFYVQPEGQAGPGVYVEKYYTDPPVDWEPVPGAKLNVKGMLSEAFDTRNANKNTIHRYGYRKELRSAFEIDGGRAPLFIYPNGEATVVEYDGGDDFGSSNATVIAHPELLGGRVHIAGPVEITNLNPPYLLRYNRDNNGPYYQRDGGENYQGYEITGGIPVIDYGTEAKNCDFQALGRDAGTGRVVFDNGITAVWDTYTQVPFCSPFPACLESGFLPDADGGRLPQKYVGALHLYECPEGRYANP